MSSQPNLFDTVDEAANADAALARARMHDMINGLSTASAAPWTDQTGVILMDGIFKRAMRLVPNDEAETLWSAFDAEMERLYAIWAATHPA